MIWLRRLLGPVLALVGLLGAAWYRWRAGKAEQRARDARTAQATAERDSESFRVGAEVQKDRAERSEEVIDAHARDTEEDAAQLVDLASRDRDAAVGVFLDGGGVRAEGPPVAGPGAGAEPAVPDDSAPAVPPRRRPRAP